MPADPGTVVSTYVQSWTSGDFETTRSTLDDMVTFRGPLGAADGIEECMQGLHGLKRIVESSERREVIVDGDDVCLIYDLVTTELGTIPTAGWFQLRDGRITAIQVFFDPRPLLPPQ
jgi:hypothetical protein